MGRQIPKKPSEAAMQWLLSLSVDPITGKVYKHGVEKGSLHASGYWRLGNKIAGRYVSFRRANIVWLHVKGYWPTLVLDHKDRVRTNDSIGNLREVTTSENNCNRRSWAKVYKQVIPREPKESKEPRIICTKHPKKLNRLTGVIPVYYNTHFKKFDAGVYSNGKPIRLGRYNTKEEAIQALQDWLLTHGGSNAI